MNLPLNVVADGAPYDSDRPYRAWWVPQVPCKSFQVDRVDLRSAVAVADMLARYDQFQFENKIKPDYSNAGGIMEWDDDEWCEVADEDLADLDPSQ